MFHLIEHWLFILESQTGTLESLVLTKRSIIVNDALNHAIQLRGVLRPIQIVLLLSL